MRNRPQRLLTSETPLPRSPAASSLLFGPTPVPFLPPCGLELLAWESPWFSHFMFRARALWRACAERGLQARRPLPFWPLWSVGVFCFVPPPPQLAPLGLHQTSFNTTHSRNQTHSLAPVVSLSADASHLAAMPRGLRHSKPIWFGAVWRDARRCGRSRVGWVGGSEIGLEDPAQVGGLTGFVGALGSPCTPRRLVDLIERASAELPNAVCAPAAAYLVVP